MREDLRELLDIARGEVLGLLPVAVAQARDDLGTQQVDLPVQDAAPEGDLALALGALVNALAQFVVGQVPGIAGIVLAGSGSSPACTVSSSGTCVSNSSETIAGSTSTAPWRSLRRRVCSLRNWSMRPCSSRRRRETSRSSDIFSSVRTLRSASESAARSGNASTSAV